MKRLKKFIRNSLLNILNRFLGGVPVTIIDKEWRTATGVWSTSYLHYNPFKDKIEVDWGERKLTQIK